MFLPDRLWFWKKCFSIKLFFRQSVIKPKILVILGGRGRVIVYFGKQAYKYYVLLFWKIIIGKTEESSLSGQTHMRAR